MWVTCEAGTFSRKGKMVSANEFFPKHGPNTHTHAGEKHNLNKHKEQIWHLNCFPYKTLSKENKGYQKLLETDNQVGWLIWKNTRWNPVSHKTVFIKAYGQYDFGIPGFINKVKLVSTALRILLSTIPFCLDVWAHVRPYTISSFSRRVSRGWNS